MYSENLVIALATAIAVLDVLFILVAMPESLPETVRPSSWGSQISWEKADPFGVRMEFCYIENCLFYNIKNRVCYNILRIMTVSS